MAKKWYVIHTYSGYENKVKMNLEHRRESMGMEEFIFDVKIPTVTETEIKEGGRRREVERKIFPGYVLVQMEFNDKSWSVVRNTPGVTGFVGMRGGLGSGDGREGKPVPLSRRELNEILRRTEPDAPRRTTTDLTVGEVVKIITGPLADFDGKISEVNADAGKVKIMVSIFGRETPVEMDFDQVTRV